MNRTPLVVTTLSEDTVANEIASTNEYDLVSNNVLNRVILDIKNQENVEWEDWSDWSESS